MKTVENSVEINNDDSLKIQLLENPVVEEIQQTIEKHTLNKHALDEVPQRSEQKDEKRKKRKKEELENQTHGVNDITYYFENGYRKVKPYEFTYETFAKGRWIGKEIQQVFNQEFRDQTAQYYERAIKQGNIQVNHEPLSSPKCIIKHHDVITHKIHRHEPPVIDTPIPIIYKDENQGVLVVEKPASIPVHPSAVNRLDRLTSGVMVLALNQKKAREIEQSMKKGEISKYYICIVQGQFPTKAEQLDRKDHININNEANYIEVKAPIKVVSHKLGLHTVQDSISTGKHCHTKFKLLAYNSQCRYSLVLCQPITGRTHQIRVHLQYMGYPIVNDPLYSLPLWKQFPLPLKPEAHSKLIDKIDSIDNSNLNVEKDNENNQKTRCNICNTIIMDDPPLNKMALYLHAYKYSSPDWCYKTPSLPSYFTTYFPDFNIDISF